ncbi:MAG TPA: DinB family protein [Ilumatobacteraceae bacterium]
MAIIPDDKNWTWVLERTCPECGFDAGSFDAATIAPALRANAETWIELLADPQVRVRPTPELWSGLEYGCHVRDVFVLFNERLRLMLETEDPTYQNWDQDATAVSQRYGEQDPADVSSALSHAAEAVAQRFASVQGEQWNRTGTRSDGARFTVSSFAQYFIHDPVHHVHDVRHGYTLLADR